MWIRCENKNLLNGKYVRSYTASDAATTRYRPQPGGYVIHHGLPEDGALLLAWTSGGTPHCIARYDNQAQADHALRLLFDALAAGRNTFDYPRCE